MQHNLSYIPTISYYVFTKYIFKTFQLFSDFFTTRVLLFLWLGHCLANYNNSNLDWPCMEVDIITFSQWSFSQREIITLHLLYYNTTVFNSIFHKWWKWNFSPWIVVEARVARRLSHEFWMLFLTIIHH